MTTFQLHAPPQRPAADLTQRSPLYVPPPIEVLDISAADERVAAFGRSTYRSRVVGKTMTSPFSILAKVRDGQIV